MKLKILDYSRAVRLPELAIAPVHLKSMNALYRSYFFWPESPSCRRRTLRVGAAQVVISPGAGTPMAGYYSTRLSTGVHDDLHAKAIVIASGDQRVALVACDLVGIPPAVIEEARGVDPNARRAYPARTS